MVQRHAIRPLGSSRIPKEWLLNRFNHVKDGGKTISEPIWSRMEGASELADLMEFSYHQKEQIEKADLEAIDMHATESEDWIQAGRFQLPLDLRKALAVRESTMDSAAKERRVKMKKKRKERKIRMEAKKQITEDEKEKIRQELQSKSRYEAMQAVEPAAKTAKPSQIKKLAKKALLKHKHKALSAGKKAKKNMLKDEKRKMAVKILKDKKKEQHEAKEPVPPPLPPPEEPPPISASLPQGIFRITSDQCLPQLYGRQGDIIGEGENEYTMLQNQKRHGDRSCIRLASLVMGPTASQQIPQV